MNKQYVVGTVLGLILIFGTSLEALAQHKGINFQAVMKKTDGTYPTASGVTVTAQILDPQNYCVLREEVHASKNISNGYLNLVLGDSAATTPVGRNPSTILSLTQVLDNKTTRTGLNCVDDNNTIVSSNQSYIPSNVDRRILRLRLNILGEDIVADFNMRAVGFAVNSEMLNSKTDEDFVNINAAKGVTKTNIESIFERFTKLDALLGNFNAGGSYTGTMGAASVTGLAPIASSGSASDLTTGTVSPARLGTGTADASTYLRGDGTWAAVSGGGGSLSGDVTGSQSATVVEKIRNQAITAQGSSVGQVLRYAGGNNWTPGFVAMTDLRSTVTGGSSFASSCGPGQTLTYNSVGDLMSCQNISITKSQVSDFPALATVAASGSYNDLSDKPTIPAAQVQADWNSASGVSQILNKPTLGALAAKSSVDLSGADATGVLDAARFPAMTGAVTNTAGSLNTTITDNAVTTTKINSLAVTNDKINDVSASKITGTLPVANGGTGVATLAANYVILGNGTSAVQTVAPGPPGDVLTSDGTTWVSQAPSAGGHTSCPAGFTLIGTSGSAEAFCISSNQEASATWGNANLQCRGKTPKARLCSASEWAAACFDGVAGPNNMTGHWEWVADLYSTYGQIMGSSGCDSFFPTTVSTNYGSRCCFR